MPGDSKKRRGTVARRQPAKYWLRDGERQLRLADNAPVAIAQCDTEARFKFVNRHYAERLGLTPEQVIGKRIPAVIGDKAWATFEPFFRECLTGKAVEFDVEVELPYQPTDPQFTHCCYEPEWQNGTVVGLVAAITNITGLKRASRRRSPRERSDVPCHVRGQQRGQDRGRAQNRPFPSRQRGHVRVRGL